MPSRVGPPSPIGSEGASALDALLSAEREIAERLGQADADAAQIVENARARVAEREAEARAALQVELEAADRTQRFEAVRYETLAAERDALERQRLDGVSDAQLISLADAALRLVLDLDDGTTGARPP